MTIAAIATAWFVDVNRRNAPRFLHLYLLARVERFEHVPYKSVEIRPNIPFAFGHVPENSFSGKMEYKLGSLPLLEFHTYGCSFAGQIQLKELMRAEVDPWIVDHVFIVTSEPDPQVALKAANGG